MLPDELQQAAPRDPSFVPGLISKNRSTIRAIYAGALIVPLLMVAIFYFKFGEDSVMAGLWSGLGIGALCVLIAFAMQVNTKRSVELFTNGTAAIGTVVDVRAPGDRNQNAYVLVKVEFKDSFGKTRLGQATTIGKTYDVDRRPGDRVAILFMKDDPKKFAIYTPGLGMAAGISKEMRES